MDDLFTKTINFTDGRHEACARGKVCSTMGRTLVFAIGNAARSWERTKLGGKISAFFYRDVTNYWSGFRSSGENYNLTEDELAPATEP